MSIKKIPAGIIGTVLRAAREMRGIRGNQQSDQWTAARYTLAEDLAATLRRDHGIVANQWVRDMTFRIAN